MNERTEIFIEQTSSFFKDLMAEKGLTAYKLMQLAEANNITISKQQIYSVLKMGDTTKKSYRPNYSIDTFVKVLSLLNVHIEFHDMNDKNNFNMTGQTPSKN